MKIKMDNTNDFDKTLRPGTDDDKTLRPSTDDEKTMRPTTDDVDKTLRPTTDDADKTLRPDGTQADKTLRPGQKNEKNPLAYQKFEEFELNNVKYRFVGKIYENSGEAIIYLVENKMKQFVLKLYFSNLNPPPNHNIMEIVKRLAGDGLLVKTFDYGFWTNPQTHEKHDYELMEYCAGSSLDQMKINGNDNLLGEIALRCAAALNSLHKKQVIHRDIKPANFFFRNNDQNIENLALADFGISIQTDKDGKANIDYRYQLRTKIYTAPEVYTNIIDGKIQISYKSDFFSLGMMLLTLWNGEEIFKIDEYELNDMKFRGKLPYPKDIGERSLQLIKALTLPDPNTRAGFDEIERWAKGEDIIVLKSEGDNIHSFKIPFKPAKNQIAKSPEELAKFMSEDHELAIRYLYSGKIAQWLTENYQPVLGQDVDDIVEKKYPKDQNAGLFATCYHLDGDMPYYDVNNKAQRSPQEIAKSLRNNIKHYETALTYREHPLFLWFNARGLENVTNEFAPLFKKSGNNRDAVLKLIYTLDQTLPWIIVTEDNKTIECYNPDDVLNAKYLHSFSAESLKDFCGEGFLTWLQQIEPATAGKIRSTNGHKERPMAVLYNLNPKVSYNFQLNEKADDYYFTAKEIGRYMNIWMEKYIIDEKNSDANDHLNQMRNIDKSPLYDYFKSKGAYDDKIDWIKYCADLKSKDNVKKAGPYNWQIGVYKAIKGLGYNPYYYFPKSDKRIYTLKELSQIPKKEIRNEMKNGYLQYWLTIFYQENPEFDLKQKYTFEKKTIDYLENIEKLDNDNVWVGRFHTAKQDVRNTLTEPARKRRYNKFTRISFGIPTLLASVVMILGLLLIFEIPYVFAILGLLIVSIRFLVSYFKNNPTKNIRYKVLVSPTFEELELEPLHFAFSEEMKFKSSIKDDLSQSVKDFSQATAKLHKGLILPWSLIIGLGIWVNSDKLKYENKTIFAAVKENIESIIDFANNGKDAIKFRTSIYGSGGCSPVGWTLNDVTEGCHGNPKHLSFRSKGAYAVLPAINKDATKMKITIGGRWLNWIILETSPDGINYSKLGRFSGGLNNNTSSTKRLPDGTKFVRLSARKADGGAPFFWSVNITGILSKKHGYNLPTDEEPRSSESQSSSQQTPIAITTTNSQSAESQSSSQQNPVATTTENIQPAENQSSNQQTPVATYTRSAQSSESPVQQTPSENPTTSSNTASSSSSRTTSRSTTSYISRSATPATTNSRGTKASARGSSEYSTQTTPQSYTASTTPESYTASTTPSSYTRNPSSIPGRFPQASQRILRVSDVQTFSKDDLKIMRNEIFARHGLIFQTNEMRTYFQNQNWYAPKHNDVSTMLTDIEKSNIQLIQRYE